jgi:alanyl-tRNA synthetase
MTHLLNHHDPHHNLKTRLLYLETPDTLECAVEVVACVEFQSGYAILMKETPFYPEGGGQPSDTGWIGDVGVTAVIQDGQQQILHLVETPLSPGIYDAKVDSFRRHDLTQQHAAQHLLSACLFERFQAETVGFHLSETYTTIDLDRKLGKEQLDEALMQANQHIMSALPIEILYPSPETIRHLPLRKIPTVTEGIRVIQIGNVDYSPCGGTHPHSTSEIGILMITRSENYKAGTRVEFLAGNRALLDYQRKNDQLFKLSQRLAFPISEIMTGVDKLMEIQDKLEKELKLAKEISLEWETSDLCSALEVSSPKYLVRHYTDRDFGDLRKLAATAVKRVPGSALILSNTADHQVQILCNRNETLTELDIRQIFQAALQILEGKGGGNAATAQGGGPRVDRREEALSAAESMLKGWFESQPSAE